MRGYIESLCCTSCVYFFVSLKIGHHIHSHIRYNGSGDQTELCHQVAVLVWHVPSLSGSHFLPWLLQGLKKMVDNNCLALFDDIPGLRKIYPFFAEKHEDVLLQMGLNRQQTRPAVLHSAECCRGKKCHCGLITHPAKVKQVS